MDWQPIETAPKDGTDVILAYKDWCGDGPLVTSGYWDVDEPDQEMEATWCHVHGYGDADF